MESKLEKAALPQEESEQVFHRKEDLENHIEKLKVSCFLSELVFMNFSAGFVEFASAFSSFQCVFSQFLVDSHYIFNQWIFQSSFN